MSLTPKQARFVAEYLIDLNASEAARRAGYSTKNANVVGSRLLANVDIAAAVRDGKARQLRTADLSAARVLEELRRLAFANVQDLFDGAGNLRPIQALPRDHAASIASLEVIKKNAEAGDGHMDVIHKLKVWDKPRSLEMLAKHFALLTEKHQLSASEELWAILDTGRQRARE